jgi:hypothetical protein
MVTLVNSFLENADLPIEVTLLGMITLVKLLSSNVLGAILLTGTPKILEGIISALGLGF